LRGITERKKDSQEGRASGGSKNLVKKASTATWEKKKIPNRCRTSGTGIVTEGPLEKKALGLQEGGSISKRVEDRLQRSSESSFHLTKKGEGLREERGD